MKNPTPITAGKLAALIVFSLLIAGCGQTLKNSWTNFRAYYNTYYNAKESFQAGLSQQKEQSVEIDADKPVRIHRPPGPAGSSDFQEAIDKGAVILRDFPSSKWVDDALLLIGKSYYYRAEFYAALQKFEELRNADPAPKMEQLAVIWKGRTLLDLNRNSEGITFLENELENIPGDWSRQTIAEIYTLLGEHRAMMENWELSQEALALAIPDIEKKSFLGRTFFLQGQVLERLGRYGEAYFAFSQVSENFPGFEYVYWAGMKRADVARKEGNLELAASIYNKLRRDDKNVSRTGIINFELARTLEMMGRPEEAENRYKQLLYEDGTINSRSLRADIYYRLGKIYSDSYSNFKLAAAYFDTSSSFGSPGDSGENGRAAQTLARAYGEYSQLRERIQHADSLLKLGSLPSEELDSVIAGIRERKRQQLLEERESESEDRLVNRSSGVTESRSTRSAIYGFLNHRNDELVERGKTEFEIIWGERPLVDNWRRMEAVRQSTAFNRQQNGGEEASGAVAGQEGDNGNVSIDVDIDEIPRSEKEREKLRMERINSQFQLGNLFFLNLNMPDSARHYFNKVVSSDLSSDLSARAMYSLHEIFKSAKKADSLRYWRNRIISEFPDTRYARLVRGETDSSASRGGNQSLKQRYREIESSEKGIKKARKLRRLALENRSSALAPQIHYRAIEEFILKARSHRQQSDSLLAGAVNPAGEDSLQVPMLLPDSLPNAAPFEPEFRSAYWDTVRKVLQEFDTTFTEDRRQQKVRKMLDFLNGEKQ